MYETLYVVKRNIVAGTNRNICETYIIDSIRSIPSEYFFRISVKNI